MEPLRHVSVVRFGTYEIALHSGELRKAGVRVRVQQQPLKLLEILLERPAEIVTREELRTRIWPNESFGDFDQAVNAAVAKLRSALGDSADNPRYIETLPKRGYRFIAEVAAVNEAPLHGLEVPDRGLARTKDRDRAFADRALASKRPWLLASKTVTFALGSVLVILIFWIFHLRSRSSGNTLLSTPIRSLAVLPLENLSGDASQDYFADGMTDELITVLGQIKALRVISRTSVMSYKRARKPLPQIARELNVDAVVEGTVLRSGSQVRITSQLIQASSDRHVWAHSYEGDLRDTLVLQNTVARAIADQIQIELTPQEQAVLKNTKAVNPEAYEDYLKGRYFWNKRTADGLKKAVAYFDQAIDKDPNYAKAYSGLADSYALLGVWEYGVLDPREAGPKAKAAATKALELDDTLSEAHTSLASVGVFEWDWDTAEKEYKRAIALNPGYATAHHWYAWHLSEMGRNSEAIAEMRKAESLDPLSLIISADLAHILLVGRLYDESIEQSRKTLELDPNFAVAHSELGQAYEQKRMYNEAITELQKAIVFSGGNTTYRSNLAHAYAVTGRTTQALKILNGLKNRSNQRLSHASEIALIYAGLDEKNQAITWLERAYEQRFDPSILLQPAFDPLRSDPRFQDLVRRIGFPH